MRTIIINHAARRAAVADTPVVAGCNVQKPAGPVDSAERGRALATLRAAEAAGVPTDPTSLGAKQVLDAAAAVCTKSCDSCPFSVKGGFAASTCHTVKDLAERAGRLSKDGSLAVAASCDSGGCASCSCTPDEPFTRRPEKKS